MSSGIKNGKHHSFNIYSIKLILLAVAIVCASAKSENIKKGGGWVIVIDAGHGGKDPGALGSISYEKNIVLAIALKTGEYIQQNIRNVKVLYTRKDDTFVDLKDRAEFANKNNADLFISIHANWAKSKNIKGTETYVMGLAKDEQNLAVAMKENAVILLENDYSTKYEGFDPKSPESYIMFTLMQNIYHEQSTGLASKIQTQYRENNNRTDRGVMQAGFWVLYMTTMPSVLTETGFITHPAEEKYLNSKEGQDYIASSIYRACREYISEIDSKSGISAVKDQDSIVNSQTLPPAPSKDEEIVFMVQVATSLSKTAVTGENFKGLKDIIEIYSSDRYKYASGKFTDYSEAVSYRKELEELYPDAFVIAVQNNKILPLQQALEQNKKK